MAKSLRIIIIVMARIELGIAVYRSGLNPNFQIPSSKQIPISNDQIQDN